MKTQTPQIKTEITVKKLVAPVRTDEILVKLPGKNKSAQKIQTRVEIVKIEECPSVTCLFNYKREEIAPKNVIAHLRALGKHLGKPYNRHFESIIAEIEDEAAQTAARRFDQLIFDALKCGYQTIAEIRSFTKILKEELESYLKILLAAGFIATIQQGSTNAASKQKGSHGRKKTLYQLTEKGQAEMGCQSAAF